MIGYRNNLDKTEILIRERPTPILEERNP